MGLEALPDLLMWHFVFNAIHSVFYVLMLIMLIHFHILTFVISIFQHQSGNLGAERGGPVGMQDQSCSCHYAATAV